MSRIQCKGCDSTPSTYDTLEGYCMLCAAKKIKEHDQQAQLLDSLENAIEKIYPFLIEDFPKGTGDKHGTCATDEYLQAVRIVEKTRNGTK